MLPVQCIVVSARLYRRPWADEEQHGARGMPVMHDDVWRLIFTYLTDGAHERRLLAHRRVVQYHVARRDGERGHSRRRRAALEPSCGEPFTDSSPLPEGRGGSVKIKSPGRRKLKKIKELWRARSPLYQRRCLQPNTDFSVL